MELETYNLQYGWITADRGISLGNSLWQTCAYGTTSPRPSFILLNTACNNYQYD